MLVRDVAEARNVEAARPAVVERSRLAHQVFHQAGHAGPHHVLAEVVADMVAGVADPVRVMPDFDSSSSRADSSVEAATHHRLSPSASNVRPLRRRRTPRRAPCRSWIDQDLARDGVGSQRQVPGVHRRIDETGGRIEGGVDVAPARAAAARAASEAPAAVLVVLQPVGRHAGTVGRENAVHLLQRVAQRHFGAVQPGRDAGRGCRADTAGSP